jgi:crotonobetainyl-CoA:carnitine CoA-transferase CaiB-like acyl-CoA transferase
MAGANLPLSRFSVLDLSSHRSGPTAVRQLADWGAQVIRIESPNSADGDVVGGDRHSPDFQTLHRNKKAMTLNLKTEEGKRIFFKLAERADVVVENYRANVKTRLGIDYEAVSKVNPRIVYGSISGFGQDGPYATRPGVDQIAQGMGGLMSITGLPGQGPVRVGIPISDLTAGLLLAQAILMALLDREVTGVGQWVNTSLLEAQVFMLDFQAARWLMRGDVAQQAGNDHPTGIPTGVFETSDGLINIAAPGEHIWQRLCAELEAPELLTDPLYATADLRSKNRATLNAKIAEKTRQKPGAFWIERLNDAGCPCGPINSIDKVFSDPQVQHLGLQRPIQHPELGEIHVVAQPIRMSKAEQPDWLRPSPRAGEHTEALLAELGYDHAAVVNLRAAKVI